MIKYRSALAELADARNLESTWRDFYRETPKSKRNSSGIDGLSFLDFKAVYKEKIQEISNELLNKRIGSNRRYYSHSPLAVFPLEKPDKNQFRIICIPTIKDRLVQKSILRLLISRGYEFETKISYGYSRNKSVKNALRKAKQLRKKKPWVYKTDIKSFFDMIPRERMKQCVLKKIKLKSLHPLFFAAIDAEISSNIDNKTKSIITAEGICEGKGLRQGLPLSPLLSNLYLEKFDKRLSSSEYSAIRYSDDLVIFCSSRNECLEAHDFCACELNEIGLSIQPPGNNSKTSIYNPEEIAEFLGLGIVKVDDEYHLRITDSQIDKVWKKFESLRDVEKNIERNIKFVNVHHRLQSMVDSYKGHYGEADNYENFENNLKCWKRNIYRSIFKDEYDVDIDNLSYKKKHFLHLLD